MNDTLISLSAPANLRSFDGIETSLGPIRGRFAMRSDDLSIVDNESAVRLVANGLTTVIDLRAPDEVLLTGRGPLAEFPVNYHHIPVMGSAAGNMSQEAPRLEHEAMGHMYVDMIEHAAPQFASALSIIALSPGTCAFHCAGGRDRTGTLAALLLLSLGAPDEAIISDYVRTEDNMPGVLARTNSVSRHLLDGLGFDYDEMIASLRVSDGGMATSMRILLDELRRRYDDPLAPLYAAGLSDSMIHRLRTRAGLQ